MNGAELMRFMVEFCLAGIATTCFAVVFAVPKQQYMACGMVGAVGWIVYSLMVWYGLDPSVATLIAAIPLTALARGFAIWHKVPVTVFLVSGIFPLVPGAGIYYSAYYFIMNDPMFGPKGQETLRIALALALGMTIVLGMPLPRRKKKS